MSEEKQLTNEELLKSIEENERMTPQEKAHARFFYHETISVKDMDDLTLDAHIEELASICFEGRSRHGAATAERNKRKVKPSVGFEKSLNVDKTATDAINVIQERQKKLTKAEKIAEGLKSLGMMVAEAYPAAKLNPTEYAEKAMSARNMAGVVKAHNNAPVAIEPKPSSTFNPFLRKKETEQNVQAAIDSILNPPVVEQEKKPFVNPFAKKADGQ